MPNLINRMQREELMGSFKDAEGMLFVSLKGLTVKETESLRSGLAEHGVRMRMVRNRLANLVLKERGLEMPSGTFVGNIGCCVGDAEDAIHAAKVFQSSPERKAGKVKLRAGLLEGNLLDEKEALALASLPTRDELRAQLLSCIAGPATNIVGLLAAPQGALVRVIQAKVDAAGAGDVNGAGDASETETTE